jgi:NADP-dependent 3-hydroxy acid dehydrogenase YdfG
MAVAWVTGASGAWGGAFVRALIAAGFDVAALGREAPAALAAEAVSAGRRMAFVRLDLGGTIPAPSALTAALPSGFGPVPDVLIHAAVTTTGDRSTLARADYLGPAELVEAVASAMVARGTGRIGILVPQNARLGLRGIGDISAPQGALWTWAEALRDGMRATSPGVTLTLVVPPRTASATQRLLAERTGHHPRLAPPDARPLLRAVLAGRRRAGRRPWLAGLSMLVR